MRCSDSSILFVRYRLVCKWLKLLREYCVCCHFVRRPIIIECSLIINKQTKVGDDGRRWRPSFYLHDQYFEMLPRLDNRECACVLAGHDFVVLATMHPVTVTVWPVLRIKRKIRAVTVTQQIFGKTYLSRNYL